MPTAGRASTYFQSSLSLRPDVTINSVVQIGSNVAQWFFDTEVLSVADPFAALSVNGNTPNNVVFGSTYSVIATYDDDFAIDDGWYNDDYFPGSIVFVNGADLIQDQSGNVV